MTNTTADPTYDCAVDEAATAILAAQAVDADARRLIVEAIRLKGGMIDDETAVTQVAKRVYGDVFDRVAAILTEEIVPRLRAQMPELADDIEAATTQWVRSALAGMEAEWPTPQ